MDRLGKAGGNELFNSPTTDSKVKTGGVGSSVIISKERKISPSASDASMARTDSPTQGLKRKGAFKTPSSGTRLGALRLKNDGLPTPVLKENKPTKEIEKSSQKGESRPIYSDELKFEDLKNNANFSPEKLSLLSYLADYPYKKNKHDVKALKLPSGKIANIEACPSLIEKMKRICNKINESITVQKDKLDFSCDGHTSEIIERKSGTVVSILQQKSETEDKKSTIYLICGGTTSGEAAGNLTERSKKNFGLTLKQWGANLSNFLGNKTDAAKITSWITNTLIMQIDKPDTKKIVLIGHSKGSSDAMNAFVNSHDRIDEYIGIGSAPAGKEIEDDIMGHTQSELIKNAIENKATHLIVQGDVVPKSGQLWGKAYTIPKSADSIGPTPLSSHDQFNTHIQEAAANWQKEL